MDKVDDLKKYRIGIFGYGKEGQSLFSYLISKNCTNIKIFDEKRESEILENNSKIISGKFENGNYEDLDIVFRSPGIKIKRLKQFLPSAVHISSPTELFLGNCRATTVGITGTKGKSTTALLVSKVLENNNKKTYVIGNIGNPMLDVLDEADENSYCVIELSSFQLQDIKSKPDVAIVLPIFPDHLDYHENEDEYVEAKKNILNDKQLIVCDLSTSKKLSISNIGNIITFSDNLSEANCNIKQDKIVCRIGDNEKNIFDSTGFAREKRIPVIDLLAACAFAFASNFEFDLKKFANFEKLPLRVELVSKKNNIKFYNDSASTNPLSTIKAMEMMSGSYFLILGGSAKGVGFDELAKKINIDSNLKKVFIYGDTAEIIAKAIESNGNKPICITDRLTDVFECLKKNLSSVDEVLFSPACASFDQYSNYKERGDDYNSLVKTINE